MRGGIVGAKAVDEAASGRNSMGCFMMKSFSCVRVVVVVVVVVALHLLPTLCVVLSGSYPYLLSTF